MVQMRAATTATSGDTIWLPCPEGNWRFTVGKPEIVESRQYRNKDGTPKYNVRFPLQLGEKEYERAKAEVELREGQSLSGKTRYTVGLSLGWFPEGKYKSTRLVDMLCMCLGKQGKNLRKFIEAGGGGGADAEEWLAWFEGAEVWGKISHREDNVTPGKFWADFAPISAVGDMPGERDDQYEAWAKGRLKALMAGETIQPTDESAPVEQGIAGGVAAREDPRQPEMVGAAAKPALQPRSYEELFPEDGE